MKTGVTEVTLIAVQELGTPPPTPSIKDYVDIWPFGTLMGYKYSIEDLAQLISSVLGSGSILPPRIYQINGVMPAGAVYSVNPDNGAGQVNDVYLDGKVYDVHRNGALLTKGMDWDNDVVGGGFRSLVDGDEFQEFEVFVLSFTPQFSPYIPTPDAIARFTNGEAIITADSVMSLSMERKLIVLQSATNKLTLTLRPASEYPENVLLCIVSNGGLHKQATIRCDGTDVILFNNKNWADFWIGQNDQLLLISTKIDGSETPNAWRVVSYSGSERFNRRGVVDFGYSKGPNQHICVTEDEVERAVYPGVWAYVQELATAQPGTVVDKSTWLLNTGLWSTGNGTTTFNFPSIPGQHPRFADPDGVRDLDRYAAGESNLPGSGQGSANLEHTHDGIEADNTAHDSSSLPHSDAQKLLVNIDNKGRHGHSTIQGAKTVSSGGYEARGTNTLGLPLLNY